jgi:hypothetical protein
MEQVALRRFGSEALRLLELGQPYCDHAPLFLQGFHFRFSRGNDIGQR